jgi:PAS domain S-box-containing protein
MRGISRGTTGQNGGGAGRDADAPPALTRDERVEILLRYANDSVLLFDSDYHIIDCNDRATEVFGYPREELLGKSLTDLRVPESDIPLEERLAANRAAGAGGTIFEGAARRRDGSTFPVEVSLRSVDSSAGQLFHTTIRDISERRAAAAELRRSRAILEEAEGAADIGHWTWDRGTDVLMPSAALLRLVGVDPLSSTPAEDLRAHIHPDDLAGRDLALEHIRRGEMVTFAYRVIRPDGEIRYIEGVGGPLFDERGELGGASGVAVDVTDRIIAADALRASEERSRLLLDSMMEGLAYCRMIYDDEGRPVDWVYLTVNPAFAALTGIEDAAGKRVTEVIPTIKEDTPELLGIYARVVETGEPAEFDIDFKPLDKWLHVSATRPREGEFVAFFYDISARVLAERRAQEDERRLHLSLEAASAGTWEWDLTTDENSWSDELWALYGLDPASDEASYASWLASVRPEDRADLEALLSQSVSAAVDLDFEWLVNSSDGTERWLLSHGSPELDAEGVLLRYRGVVIDVTERKRGEQALREREESYGAIFNGSPFAMALMTADSRVVEANTAFFELMGGTRDDIVGRTVVELGLAPAGDVKGLAERLRRDGVVRDAELSRTSLSGRPFDVSLDLTPVTIGGRDNVLSIYRDITEQKRAEAEAQEERTKLDAALRSMTDAVYIFDADGKLVDFNDAFVTFNRYASRDECVTSLLDYPGISEVLHPDGRAAAFEEWPAARALRGEVGTDQEFTVRRTDIDETWVGSFSFSPLRDEAGEITGAVIVARDITERKELERAARENAELLRTVLENSRDGINMLDLASGRYVFMNEAQVALTGFTPEETHDMPAEEAFERVHPDDREISVEQQRRVALGEDDDQPVEYRWRVKSGEYRWFSDRRKLVRDAQGEPTALVGVSRDITEQKRVDEALRRSEAQARETVERLSRAQLLGHIGDWDWDVTTGVVQWSDEVYRMYGVGREFPTTFETIIPMTHPDDNEANLQAAQAILDDRERSSGALQFRIIRPDGGVRHIFQTLAVDRDEEGRPTRVFGLMQDLTELRQAEEARVHSERSLQRIYDAGLVGVMFWSPNGAISDTNDRFLDMLGYTREDLDAGRIDWTGITPPEWDARDLESLEELRTTGRNAVPFEKEYLRKDGTRLPILIAGAMLDDEGARGIAVVLDISEQKRAEEKLRRFNIELEERVRRRTMDLEAANAELEAFAYSVSHDLRAPLRHIAGFAQLLGEEIDGDGDGSENRHFIDRITHATADMSVLIDDLLQFSRVGRAEMHVELVDMAALLGEELEVVRGDLGERRVEVAVGEILPASGDKTLLRQVWANIVGNAFKYTRGRDPARIEVGSQAEDGRVVYRVSDNGVGFDMQYADRLFRVFERLHRSDEFEGTGIGLANVSRILGRHDGSCWAESVEGEGSTFYFSLPAG